ncbi:MAG: threonine/serine exporter family protein [Agathobacter sp.]|nr:threonine/serine exporter family protein [Agathobacter sp.]
MIGVLQSIFAMVATISFAILFQAPKKELPFCGFTGALGWIIYYILTKNGVGIVFSSAISSFVLAIFARCFAVLRKKPVTLYLLPGIFPLVPGAGIYYTAYYVFTGENTMASSKGIETFELAGAIVIGIIFASAIPQKVFHKVHSIREKEEQETLS